MKLDSIPDDITKAIHEDVMSDPVSGTKLYVLMVVIISDFIAVSVTMFN